MLHKIKRNILKILLFIVIFSWLLSCGVHHSNIEISPEISFPKGLLRAVTLYWEARIERDHRKAFYLEAPYFQEVVLFDYYETYLKFFEKTPLKRIKIKKISCPNGNICELIMELHYADSTRGLKDWWIKIKNKWYHVIKDPLFFPFTWP